MNFNCTSYSYDESTDTISAIVADDANVLIFEITHQPCESTHIKRAAFSPCVDPEVMPKILAAFVQTFQSTYLEHADACDSPAALSAEQLSFSVDI